VTVTVDNVSEESVVVDEIPASWRVVSEHESSTSDGRQTVTLGEVPADGSATFTYFVEAPDGPGGTNQYTFGPATAQATGSDESAAFGGTETNYVVGISTQAPF
jgi:hypothetical protein